MFNCVLWNSKGDYFKTVLIVLPTTAPRGIILDRHNFTTMTRYINNPDNLKLMMNMLREKSRNIQFEAFHVFKVNCG